MDAKTQAIHSLITRNVEDAIYYKNTGWNEASDYCFNQAVLLCGDNRDMLKTLEVSAFIAVLRWMNARH